MTRARHGMTLVEAMVSIALLVFVVIAIARLTKGVTEFALRYRLQRTMITEARTCMDTITRVLRTGQPSTVSIDLDSTLTPLPPPNSRIRFTTRPPEEPMEIYWNNYEVFIRSTNSTGPGRKLASNVGRLSFTADMRDPAQITVSMEMEGSAGPNASYAFTVPDQVVQVGGGL